MSRPQISRAGSLSSASSFSSISDMNIDTDVDAQTTSSKSSEPKRTRKRFSQEQLIVLEQAYHRSTHPTREEREVLAKQTDMNFKSVTIWFQNKRQTERKIALNNSADRSVPSPFATCPAHTSADQFASTDLSGHPSLASSQSSTLLAKVQTCLPRTASGFISLDRIASRSERPPRTPTKLTRHASYENRPRSPEALWDSMLSSPIQPEKGENTRDGPESPTARDYLDFASARCNQGNRLQGRRTLEWACAAARMSVDKDDNNFETGYDEAIPKVLFNVDYELVSIDDDASTEIVDTEMESVGEGHEAITPDHSQIMFSDHPSPTLKPCQINLDASSADEKKLAHTAIQTDNLDTEKDAEILDAAWALCGLSSLRR